VEFAAPNIIAAQVREALSVAFLQIAIKAIFQHFLPNPLCYKLKTGL
jgi:hypothetical protein